MNQNFSIETFRHNLEIIRETISQINKDLSIFDLDIVFSGNEQTAYREVKEQLIILFKELLNRDAEKVFALLYRIDVPENKVKEVPASCTFEEHIAELVLERELLKVVIRKFYSQ